MAQAVIRIGGCSTRQMGLVMRNGESARPVGPSLRSLRPLSTSIPRPVRQKVPAPAPTSRQASQVSHRDQQAAGPSRSRSPLEEYQPELPNERYLEAWTCIGVPRIVAIRLLHAFPHIQAPTPAQRAFILSVFRGKDVYLRDHMGRGKTLSISIIVASLAYRLYKALPGSPIQGPQLIVLLPTKHLLHQVQADLLLLDPSFFHPHQPYSPHEDIPRLFTTLQAPTKADEAEASEKGKEVAQPEIASTLVLLSTPRDLLQQKDTVDLNHVRSVLIDEPDSMLPQLPGRHVGAGTLHIHAVNRHPPALVDVMNHILDIRSKNAAPTSDPALRRKTRLKETPLNVDFSNKRVIQTIWTSGTIDSAFRRFVMTRGWVRRKEVLVDLDFTPSATERQIAMREEATIVPGQKTVTSEPTSSIQGVEPDHYALAVDIDTGDMAAVSPSSLDLSEEEVPLIDDGSIQPTILESLVLLHTTSPPPDDTYALVVCPEGTSLDTLQKDLTQMGAPAIHLEPDILQDIASVNPDNTDAPPILIARRSVVAGLHLPGLHTIYLLGGLDAAHTYKAPAIREKVGFYGVVAGRVGRLGTNTDRPVNPKQRVISLVPKDSRDEKLLGEMFYGKYSVRSGLEGSLNRGEEVDKRWELKEWDVEETNRVAAELAAAVD